jgi:ceramide glucosyltransferase
MPTSLAALSVFAVAAVAWVLSAMLLAAFGVTCFFQWVACRYFRRKVPDNRHTPPISVLKPLCGTDPNLYTNLSSLAAQDYPYFELIFGVERADDPACAVVRRLQGAYPHVDISLVIQGPALGLNPKVANLASASRRARHPLWLISDANVRPHPDYLRAMANEMHSPEVGLVCSTLVGESLPGLGALCEDLHLATFVMASVSAAMALATHPCVVGKSMLMRHSAFVDVGGWHPVRNILAEDYVLGQRFAAKGYRVVMSPHVVPVDHSHRSLQAFFLRHARWAQMRRTLNFSAYVGEWLLNPVLMATLLLGLCTASAWQHVALPGRSLFVAAALSSTLLKILCDAATVWALSRRRLRFWEAAVIPFKDCLVGIIWLVAFLRRTVCWHGHVLRLGAGSSLRPPGATGLAAAQPPPRTDFNGLQQPAP